MNVAHTLPLKITSPTYTIRSSSKRDPQLALPRDDLITMIHCATAGVIMHMFIRLPRVPIELQNLDKTRTHIQHSKYYSLDVHPRDPSRNPAPSSASIITCADIFLGVPRYFSAFPAPGRRGIVAAGRSAITRPLYRGFQPLRENSENLQVVDFGSLGPSDLHTAVLEHLRHPNTPTIITNSGNPIPLRIVV